ncbi:MAG: CHASE domain-containing protein [Bacillota bacterium]|nr:CHASE domain-containing protein [Bacillota bacterium]
MKKSFSKTYKPLKYQKFVPYIVLAVLLAFFIFAWQSYENIAMQEKERQYNLNTDNIIKKVTERLHHFEMILQSGAGIFVVPDIVTREDWQAYYRYWQGNDLFPDIQGIVFSRIVRTPELVQHIEGIRDKGFPDYTVWPEGEHELYTPAVFIEPFNAINRRAFGYNGFSEPVRRAAMERALDTGTASITGKVKLIMENELNSQSGFLMYVPVYSKKMPLNTPRERNEAIKGFVSGGFRMQDLIQGIFPDPVQNIGFQIYDGTEASKDMLLYDSLISSSTDNADHEPLFTSCKTIDLYGHQWTFAFETLPAFGSAVDQYTSWGILATGLLVSFLIFFYLKTLHTTGDRALSLAREMTFALSESERKYRYMTENIADVIWTIDLEGNITYISPAIEKLIGFTSEEVMSMPISDFTVHEDFNVLLTKLAEELAKPPAERNSTIIIPVRHITKDRHIVHAEFSASWLFDKQGNLIGIQGTTRNITERKEAEYEIQHQRDRAESLLNMAYNLNAKLKLKVILRTICKEIVTALRVPLAAFQLFDKDKQTFYLADSIGLQPEFAKLIKPLPKTVYDEFIKKQGKSGLITDLDSTVDIPFVELLRKFGIKSYTFAVLEREDSPMGILLAGSTSEKVMLANDAPSLLSGLANLAASAIDNSLLFHELENRSLELLQAYDATIEGWAHALSLKDEETEEHSQRVTELTLRIAGLMGISDENLIHVRRGALLHDIGKMGIPDGILLKPGQLNEEEWTIMRKHPVYAYDMLSSIDYLRPALDIPYCHHEKFDGSGYPRGLKGKTIPLAARIFTVVDVYDALTSDRPYRKAWSREEALEYIRENSGNHFDPQVVEVFLKEIDNKVL